MKRMRRPDVDFVTNTGFRAHRIHSMDMVGFHQHNDIEIGLMDSKPVDFYVGSRLITIPTFRFTAFWSLVPHRNINPPAGASWWGVYIPFHTFLSWGLPEEFMRAILQGRFIIDPSPENGKRDADSFARWHTDINSKNRMRERSAALEIEARMLRLALEVGEGEESEELKTQNAKSTVSRPASLRAPLTNADLGRVEAMVFFITEHFREAIQVKDVAEAVGVHPKYAMRLFHNTCGVTLLQYLTQHRVWHAQRLLATTTLTLDEVAQESGFGSLSRFHEVFKRVSHSTPHEYRESSSHQDI